ncbi:c-type cytochrome biogenesis protein CcmI [Paralimibaculum aggregatum]|uniref:C-type cytochrome biogenesis protein CcmI n=1 Tax=Paralimibaculum aggregatum TaxID=3036245 RepID=A0ABQ6LQ42_9RHOB|nr:c-type cytochrome biogenesis protein CcmI [Limibaculum sp. NKW23]GMG84759.1 c-type cytochrome biogenesis protein CcmI [Limibaculum sp. NKW23]
MSEFLIGAILLGAMAVLALALPLLRARGAETSRAARDAAVYRDQLAELERDIARGLIGEAEAVGTRAEISRRLIAATRAAESAGQFAPAPRRFSSIAAGAALFGVPALALLIYLLAGRPGLEDAPFAGRSALEQRAAVAMIPGQGLSQDEAVGLAFERGLRQPPAEPPAEIAGQLEELKAHLAANPQEIEGRRILAGVNLRLGRFEEAAALFAEIQRIDGPRPRIEPLLARAEALVLAAGGHVSKEAEAMVAEALEIDGSDPVARYFAGLVHAQRGELERAAGIWRALRDEAAPDAPWLPMVEGMLARIGVPPARRAAPAGPAGVDPEMAAAVAAMSPEERAAFMADRLGALEARLTGEGGPPEDWVMLMRAFQVSGRGEDAARIYRLAQAALEGGEAGFVREQALLLGVIAE